jgi:hypothetical protein
VIGAGDGFRAWFARAEVDSFLDRLLAGAVSVPKAPKDAYCIPAAAKRACCSASEIVRLILERKLTWVGRLTGERGYMAVLVNVEEVRQHVRREDHGGVSLRQVEQRLGTSTAVVKALIRLGHLPSRTAINPVNRCPQTVVDPGELEAFQRTYVSLAALAAERGKHFRRLKAMLDEAGVAPAFEEGTVPATFYRRGDLVEVYEVARS